MASAAHMNQFSPRGQKRIGLSEIDANIPPAANVFAYADYANDFKKRKTESDKKTIGSIPTPSKTNIRTANTSIVNNSRVNNSRMNTSTVSTARGGTGTTRVGGIGARLNTSTASVTQRSNTRTLAATSLNNSRMNTSRINSSTRTVPAANSKVTNTRNPSASAVSRQKQEEQNAKMEQLSTLKEELSESEFKCQQIQVNYDDLKDQYQRVVLERDSLKVYVGTNCELSKEMNVKQTEMTGLLSEISRVKLELEDANRDARALKERHNALEDRALRIQKEREEDDARHRREKIDLESKMDMQRREYIIEMDTIRNDNEQSTRELKDDFDKVTRTTKMETERFASQLQNENRTLKIDLDFSDSTCKNQKENIGQLEVNLQERLAELVSLEQQLVLGEEERRVLHNTIIELKGNIRVFCRIRPPSSAEVVNSVSCQECDNLISVNQKDKKMNFNFDKVFGAESDQKLVFGEISQLVQSALDGYKVSIFAYGQTGSGKTFTMEGTPNQPGVIPQAVKKIFHTIEVKKGMREFKQWSYSVTVTYLEIYNETIRDLLAPSNSKSENKLEIKHENGVASVTNLISENVSCSEEVMYSLKKAAKNRSVASTNMNERSSRSHSVFTLSIHGTNSETKQRTHGVLNLIDLAGSERLNSSGAVGDRMKETKHINSSLSCLGDVIFSLAKKANHVPYRNSKLTYLLQPYLDGEGKCLMFVNVGPEESFANETLCSLRFAAKVNGCDIGVAQRRIK